MTADRFEAMKLSRFGAVALFLALLGVYGARAYLISLRRQEFGIRTALGSGKGALIGLVLRQAAYPFLLDARVELTNSLIAQRWMRGLLIKHTS